jgi:hypothetical protein
MRAASSASVGSSAVRARRRRATTSSSLAGSPRRCTRSAWAPPKARVGRRPRPRLPLSLRPRDRRAAGVGSRPARRRLGRGVRASRVRVPPPARLAGRGLAPARPPAVPGAALDGAGRRIPAGRVAFDVFCAVGFLAGKPRLWRAEAFPTAHPNNWRAFLAALLGPPKRIVCDAHGAMLQAISELWPEVERHQCGWHLQHALERLPAKEARRSPSAELEELRERVEGGAHRALFLAALRRRGASGREREPRPLDRRQRPDDRGPVRPPPSRRPADMPLTTSALELVTRPIATALYPRRYALKTASGSTAC